MDVENVKISGLAIHNIQQHGIVISGRDNEVSGNEIYDCFMENKENGKKLDYGWQQCIELLHGVKIAIKVFLKILYLKTIIFTKPMGKDLIFLNVMDAPPFQTTSQTGFR